MSNPECSRSCCGCLSLKAGSYLSGAYSLLISLLGVVGCVVMIKVYVPMLTQKAADMFLAENPEYLNEGYTRDDIIQLVSVATWAYWLALGLYVIWFVVSLLLMLGVATHRRGLMLAFVIFTCVVSGLCGVSLINSLIHARTTFAESTGVVTVVILALLILLNVYAIWCVATYMRELKESQCAGAVVSLSPVNLPPYNPPEYAEYNKCPDIYVKQ